MSQPVIDLHIHIQPTRFFRPEALAVFLSGENDAAAECDAMASDPVRLLRRMDAEGVERVGLINYVSPEVMGFGREVNDWVTSFVKADPMRLIAFGSVNPRFSDDVRRDLDRLVAAGIRGIKVHPPHQLFRANAYTDGLTGLADLYSGAQAAGLPVMFHTGTSIFPGARNKFADPMDVDDVTVDFPDLKIILAHGGRPIWMPQTFFLLRRHANVFLDVSGIPPSKLLEYFPRLEEVADRVLWGTDWPSPGVRSMRVNVDRFLRLPLPDDTKRKILYDNAARLFA